MAVLSPTTRLDSAWKPHPLRGGSTGITPNPNHARHTWAWEDPVYTSKLHKIHHGLQLQSNTPAAPSQPLRPPLPALGGLLPTHQHQPLGRVTSPGPQPKTVPISSLTSKGASSSSPQDRPCLSSCPCISRPQVRSDGVGWGGAGQGRRHTVAVVATRPGLRSPLSPARCIHMLTCRSHDTARRGPAPPLGSHLSSP